MYSEMHIPSLVTSSVACMHHNIGLTTATYPHTAYLGLTLGYVPTHFSPDFHLTSYMCVLLIAMAYFV